MHPIFLILLALLLYSSACAESITDNDQHGTWKVIASDVAMYRKTLGPELLSLLYPKLSAYKVSVPPSNIRVLAAPIVQGSSGMSVKEICQHFKQHICINANFFDEKRNPLGIVMTGGKIKSPIHQLGRTLTGLFVSNQRFYKIIHREDFSKFPDSLEAFQAGPRLIANGKKLSGLEKDDRSSRRSGLCINNNNDLILWVIHGGFGGATLSKLQEILLLSPFNCVEALNLDGGGSSQLYVSGKLPGATAELKNMNFPGEDPVPVALGIYLGGQE